MGAIAPVSLSRAAARGLVTAAFALLACVVVAQPAAADQTRSAQWQLNALDAKDAWKVSTGNGVIVAVLDSGVDAGHPDLAGQVLPGVDLVDGGDGRVDPVGHGTTVAGLIAGRADDNTGVAGIAPGAKILPVRVLDKLNKYDDPAVIAKGMRWAVDHGATVLNLSLGGALRSDAIAEALRYAAARDVVVVACTGNVATDPSIHEVWYPAREPGVVAVAGLTGGAPPSAMPTTSPSAVGGQGGGDDGLWAGSLTGPETVLTAPADNLTGARPGGGYWQVQGTSFAAPLVAATASLIRSKYPTMSAANVINRLIGTAKDLGPEGRDDEFGYGEVDPLSALREPVEEVAANPLTVAAPKAESGKPAQATAETPASATPSDQGVAAPLPAAEDAGLAGARQSPAAEPVGYSVTIGLVATLLILVVGAAGILAHHRTRRPDRF
ncbi:S8 family serine peptidase [Dactylosporangium sp. NBC_01737]|uniref:S8 family serine peptidase n=1 Tax=Dactylosporangium sp. NBC_01737 TaxID=2975959 RepID=UPI002E111868|nr:S8 family serine peptidase [Dactylosporangium sp. NBC_01737]